MKASIGEVLDENLTILLRKTMIHVKWPSPRKSCFPRPIDKGRIVFKRSQENWWFNRDGIEFDDDSFVGADVVVLATGYGVRRSSKSYCRSPSEACWSFLLVSCLYTYRGTIHPLIPNMAFVGYLESVSNRHSCELRSIWLASFIYDKFKLPSVKKMMEQTTKELESDEEHYQILQEILHLHF